MRIVRGQLLPVRRLHARFEIVPRPSLLKEEWMLVVVESQGKSFFLFAGDLVGTGGWIKSLGESFKEVGHDGAGGYL
jgi:chemotaxis protein histidine kinase CheA